MKKSCDVQRKLKRTSPNLSSSIGLFKYWKIRIKASITLSCHSQGHWQRRWQQSTDLVSQKVHKITPTYSIPSKKQKSGSLWLKVVLSAGDITDYYGPRTQKDLWLTKFFMTEFLVPFNFPEGYRENVFLVSFSRWWSLVARNCHLPLVLFWTLFFTDLVGKKMKWDEA